MRRRQVHPSQSYAVLVRLVAFVAGAGGLVLIPATLVAATSGHVTYRTALFTVGIAVALLVTAAVMVRPFDPLRS